VLARQRVLADMLERLLSLQLKGDCRPLLFRLTIYCCAQLLVEDLLADLQQGDCDMLVDFGNHPAAPARSMANACFLFAKVFVALFAAIAITRSELQTPPL
jgi:hypothetical protein